MSKVSLRGRKGAKSERQLNERQLISSEDQRFVEPETAGTGKYSTSLWGRTGAKAERQLNERQLISSEDQRFVEPETAGTGKYLTSLRGRTGAKSERQLNERQLISSEDLRFVEPENYGTGKYLTSLRGRTGAKAERLAKAKRTDCDDIIAEYEERLRVYEDELKRCKTLKASGGRFSSRRNFAKRVSARRQSNH